MRIRCDRATAGVAKVVAIAGVFLLGCAEPEKPVQVQQPGQGQQQPAQAPGVSGSSGYLAFDDDYVTLPAIADLAATLGYDPDRIFAFVRDEVSYESYAGILRGALGTLQGRAGNGADQAVLLYALLRESGRDVRFAHARLDRADAAELLDSMFAPRLNPSVPGDEVPTSGLTADPVNDTELLAEASDHVWVQMSTPEGWQDLDPAFGDNKAGQSRTDPNGTFAMPPDDWYHGVELRVRLERVADNELVVTHPLVFQGRVADLAGQQIGYTHLPEALIGETGIDAAQIGRVLAARHRRFVPALRIGDGVLLGDAFTEGEGLDTESPVGRIGQALGGDPTSSGAISGEWLELRFTTPAGDETRLERVVFDRLGPAARARNDLASIARVDVTQLLLGTYLSLLVEPHQLPVDAARGQVAALLDPRRAEREPLEERLAELQEEGIESEIRRFLEETILPHSGEVWFDVAHATNQLMAAAADAVLADERQQLAVRAYPAGPRLYITHLGTFADVNEGRAGLGIDLRHVPLRVLAYPGVDRAAEVAYQMLYGIVGGALEGSLVEQLTGRESISVPAVFAAAAEQGVETATFLPQDAAAVDKLLLPEDARARLARDLADGYGVTVPVRFVTLPSTGDEPRSGWWRHDLQTGAVAAVMDNGLHLALTFYERTVTAFVVGKGVVPGLCPAGCPTDAVDVLVGFDHALMAFSGSALALADCLSYPNCMNAPPTTWRQLYSAARSRTAADLSTEITAVMLAGLSQQMSTNKYRTGVQLAFKLINGMGP